jgi:hypothetical protein
MLLKKYKIHILKYLFKDYLLVIMYILILLILLNNILKINSKSEKLYAIQKNPIFKNFYQVFKQNHGTGI